MKKLTELHPLTKKLRLAEKYLDEIGIRFEWDGYKMVVTDTQSDTDAIYRDNDSGEEISCVPYSFETKLNIE